MARKDCRLDSWMCFFFKLLPTWFNMPQLGASWPGQDISRSHTSRGLHLTLRTPENARPKTLNLPPKAPPCAPLGPLEELPAPLSRAAGCYCKGEAEPLRRQWIACVCPQVTSGHSKNRSLLASIQSCSEAERCYQQRDTVCCPSTSWVKWGSAMVTHPTTGLYRPV